MTQVVKTQEPVDVKDLFVDSDGMPFVRVRQDVYDSLNESLDGYKKISYVGGILLFLLTVTLAWFILNPVEKIKFIDLSQPRADLVSELDPANDVTK